MKQLLLLCIICLFSGFVVQAQVTITDKTLIRSELKQLNNKYNYFKSIRIKADMLAYQKPADKQPSDRLSMEMIQSGRSVFYKSGNNLLIKNDSLSMTVDFDEKAIEIFETDSFELKQIMQLREMAGFNDSLLVGMDKVYLQENADGTCVLHMEPGTGNMEYYELIYRKADRTILRTRVQYASDHILDTDARPLVVTNFTIELNPVVPASTFQTNTYIYRKGTRYMATNTYRTFTITQ